MTKRVIAYRNSTEEFDDSLFGIVWNFAFPHALRATAVAAVISTPVFIGGFLFAPAGTSRVDHGTDLVGRQHSFLWEHGGHAVGAVVNGATGLFEAINDNGANQ